MSEGSARDQQAMSPLARMKQNENPRTGIADGDPLRNIVGGMGLGAPAGIAMQTNHPNNTPNPNYQHGSPTQYAPHRANNPTLQVEAGQTYTAKAEREEKISPMKPPVPVPLSSPTGQTLAMTSERERNVSPMKPPAPVPASFPRAPFDPFYPSPTSKALETKAIPVSVRNHSSVSNDETVHTANGEGEKGEDNYKRGASTRIGETEKGTT